MIEDQTEDERRPQESSFYTDYLDVVQGLRSALIDAFESVGATSSSPREASRQLGLDKNITWKLSKIVHESEPDRIAQSIPGTSGVRLVVKALEQNRAPDRLVRGVEDAFERFERLIEVHSDSRESLELMLDGISPRSTDRVQKSRKLAYRGNSGIWSVQARTRLCTHFLALGDDPSQLITAQVGGYLGFQRLCPGPPWPLFRFHIFNDDGADPLVRREAIDENHPEGFPFFLPEFSKGELPELLKAPDDFGMSYELGEGAVGKTGECDAIYGYVDTAPKTRYRDEHNRYGELLSVINTPIETLVFDLIVQRELAEQIEPYVRLYGRATGLPHSHALRDQRTLLPVVEQLTELAPGEHILTTPLVPRYYELGAKVFGRLGRSPEDFCGWRLVMPYPVMPSTVSIMFDLPEAPTT